MPCGARATGPSNVGPRVLIAALAAAVLSAPLAPAPATADHRQHATVLRAADAVEAALAWSVQAYPDGAAHALLARADAFADTVAAGLPQGTLRAPLLLTPSDRLDARVAAELERLGAERVDVLGGAAAVGEQVEAELRERGLEVGRLAGPSRVDTAIAVARAHAPEAALAVLVRAFGDASGDETRAWADALAAGAWAAERGRPVLLSAGDALPAQLAAYLEESPISGVFAVGGVAALSDQVLAQVQALGVAAQRVAGPNRFATAVEIARRRGVDAGAPAVVVEGQHAGAWAAGLTAAGWAARQAAPVLLANGAELPPETFEALVPPDTGPGDQPAPEPTASPTAEPSPSPTGSPQSMALAAHDEQARMLVCGPGLDTGACDAAAAALGYDTVHALETASDAPELVHAKVLERGEDLLRVAFHFDEAVDLPALAASSFRVLAANTLDPRSATAVAVDPATPSLVEARFAVDHVTAHATVASVRAGAVSDAQDLGNPDAAVDLADAVRAPGRTNRPDLVTAELAPTQVRLTFDQRIDAGFARNVAVVSDDGRTLEGTGQAAVDQDGRTLIVPFAGLVPERARRVVARADAAFSGQNGNVLHTLAVADGGRSAGPDLVAVELQPRNDTVVLTFDADVAPFAEGGSRTGFRLWYDDGSELSSADTTERTGPDTVLARFPAGALNPLLAGVAVTAGAVLGPEAVPAADDSITIGRAFGFGERLGPRLTEAAVAERTQNVLPQQVERELRLRFDQPVQVSPGTRVWAVEAGGARTRALSCSAGPAVSQDEVVCTLPPQQVGTRPPVAVSLEHDAVRVASAWRLGTDPASGFGRGVNLPGTEEYRAL